MKHTRRSVRYLVCWWVLVVLCTYPVHAEPLPFGDPEPGDPPDAAVGFEEAQRVALRHAQMLWGEVRPGPVIACTDLNGRMIARQFLFRRSAQDWPSNAVVLSQVRWGLAEYRRLSQQSAPESPVESFPLSGAERARQWRWGLDEYGTIVVSATRDRVPVPERIHGLPPYFTRMDEALEVVHAKLGSTDVRLKRVIYLSPVDQWFEFEIRGMRIFIDAQALRLVDPSAVALRRRRGAARPDAAARGRLDALWREALGER